MSTEELFRLKLVLTPTECFTILVALRIAIEDGSIYGDGENDAKIDRTINAIRWKLGDKNAEPPPLKKRR